MKFIYVNDKLEADADQAWQEWFRDTPIKAQHPNGFPMAVKSAFMQGYYVGRSDAK